MGESERFPVREGAAPIRHFADTTPGGSFAISRASKVRRHRSLGLAISLLAILPGTYATTAQVDPTIPRVTFTKFLKGGSPEYIAVSIDANGKGTYDSRSSDDASTPASFQASTSTTDQVFSLTQSLDCFRSIDLDSHHKIANMGLKTLIYQNGQEIHKVQYNYSEKRAAQRLTDIFERISNVEERISELGHAMKYDRLSLPETLNQIQAGLDDDSFVEAQLMIPTLEKISTDPHLMHLAQSRALEILQRVRQNK